METKHRFQALGCALFLILAGCSRGPKTCEVCQREECRGMAFRVTLESGKTVETCCPRCGLHYLESNHLTARALHATDLTTGQWLDARTAIYVSGSDVQMCAHLQPLRAAQGCCALPTYDRCSPGLIAFSDRTAAAAFQKKHGGELLTFADLLSNSATSKTQPGGKS